MIKSPVVSTSKAPGSCGELWQGRLDGYPAHITCPVDIFSEARVSRVEGKVGGEINNGAVRVSRNGSRIHTSKTEKALINYLNSKSIADNFDVEIKSSLIPGKGMASSTADIAAAVTSLAALLDHTLADDELADIALRVDPTDGIFLSGISVFDHYGGRIVRSLGTPPPIGIVILDFGGTIDSQEFSSSEIEYSSEDTAKLLFGYDLIAEGMANWEPKAIGAGSTISAFVNQKYLRKQALEAVSAFADSVGAYGINAAHSGTVIGLLAEPSDLQSLSIKIRERFPDARARFAGLIGGGVKYKFPTLQPLIRRQDY